MKPKPLSVIRLIVPFVLVIDVSFRDNVACYLNRPDGRRHPGDSRPAFQISPQDAQRQ
jgi:hypothetical protein